MGSTMIPQIVPVIMMTPSNNCYSSRRDNDHVSPKSPVGKKELLPGRFVLRAWSGKDRGEHLLVMIYHMYTKTIAKAIEAFIGDLALNSERWIEGGYPGCPTVANNGGMQRKDFRVCLKKETVSLELHLKAASAAEVIWFEVVVDILRSKTLHLKSRSQHIDRP
ncbi:hypothetical protein Trydic_g17913 [Trypoxylus dichotomus]